MNAPRPERLLNLRDQKLFHERHANDSVVVSARRIEGGIVHCTATLGGERDWALGPQPRRESREYLVPEDEYAARHRFGFVIDPGSTSGSDKLLQPSQPGWTCGPASIPPATGYHDWPRGRAATPHLADAEVRRIEADDEPQTKRRASRR